MKDLCVVALAEGSIKIENLRKSQCFVSYSKVQYIHFAARNQLIPYLFCKIITNR